MGKEYTFRDLQEEMAGMKVGTGRMSFSGQLKQSLGDARAVQWYFHTKFPGLQNLTPHEYVEKRGEKGKKSLASQIYDVFTGQSD